MLRYLSSVHFQSLLRNGINSNHSWVISNESKLELDNLLDRYAEQELKRTNLATLLSFGRPLSESSLLLSAAYALSEIPLRLVRRVRAFEKLPFIVGTNPFISRILSNYRLSFQQLATYPEIQNLSENDKFAKRLEQLVQAHAHDVPVMAKGYRRRKSIMHINILII